MKAQRDNKDEQSDGFATASNYGFLPTRKTSRSTKLGRINELSECASYGAGGLVTALDGVGNVPPSSSL